MPTTAGKLATELGTTPELVLDACRRAGLSAFSDQTPLDDRETQRVRHAIDDAPSPDLLPAPPTSTTVLPGAPRPRRRLPAWAIGALVVVALGIVGVLATAVTGSSDDDAAGAGDGAEAVVGGVPFGGSTAVAPTTVTTVLSHDPITGLSVGNCWTDPTVPDLREESSGTRYDQVPCAQPHQAEVYAMVAHPDPPGAPYPGDAAVAQFADNQCAIRFEGFVGRSLFESLLNGSSAYPIERSWLMDDRIVVCSAYALDGSLLTGSVAGSGR